MIKRKKDNLVWFEFELLSNFSQIQHAIFPRPLNFGYKMASESLGQIKELGFDCLSYAKLVHGNVVREAKEGSAGECDGLVTDQSNLTLLMTHADCQAALFYDMQTGAIANVHCGWRGNVANIYGATVEKMGEVYGSRPKDLIVCISPSLGPTRAEFVNADAEFPKKLHRFKTYNNYFNLWEMARQQLIEAYVPDSQIEIAEICTFSSPDYYSYRKNQTKLRNCTVILKN